MITTFSTAPSISTTWYRSASATCSYLRTEVERQTMHSEVVGRAEGIMVAGVPVGEAQYEYEQMRVIGGPVRELQLIAGIKKRSH
eukprot:7154206-Prymnesium_polylepis.1